MSIWDDQWEDYEIDKHDFECWLDSLEGEGTDMDKQADKEWEAQQSVEYPEWVITTPNYLMTISNN